MQLTDYIRNTFADEVYNVYHGYDPVEFPPEDLADLKNQNEFSNSDFAPLLENYKGGCP